MTDCCPHCHQPYKATRVGIPMPPRKAELFDSIKAAGEIGITTHELWIMHYPTQRAAMSVIKSHINQINDLLVETDYTLRAEGRGKDARWIVGRA